MKSSKTYTLEGLASHDKSLSMIVSRGLIVAFPRRITGDENRNRLNSLMGGEGYLRIESVYVLVKQLIVIFEDLKSTKNPLHTMPQLCYVIPTLKDHT